MNKETNTTKLLFKPVKIYNFAGLFSFVFSHRDNVFSPFKRYKKSYGINRIDDLDVRNEAAVVMAKTINEALAKGWNPARYGLQPVQPEIHLLPDLLKAALKSILNKTDKKRTESSYNSHFKQLVEYLTKFSKYHILAAEFTKRDAIEYQDYLINTRLANKTINTKTEFAFGLFQWLLRADYISVNPFSAVERLKEKVSEKNKIFTHDEIQKIKEYSLKHKPELWQYVLMLYYCLLRPANIAAIQRKDIDIENGWITIRGIENKNGNDCKKEIVSEHLTYLVPYVKDLKPEIFVFGKEMKPNKVRIAPTRFAELWRLIVVEKLGIDKPAYGLKNTGAAHFLELNKGAENLKWLQMQMNHADLQTTSIYTNKMSVIRLDENSKVPKI